MKKPDAHVISDTLYHVKHGMKMPCPVCSSPGQLDLSSLRVPFFEHSIWYNIKCNKWECWDCWLK